MIKARTATDAVHSSIPDQAYLSELITGRLAIC